MKYCPIFVNFGPKAKTSVLYLHTRQDRMIKTSQAFLFTRRALLPSLCSGLVISKLSYANCTRFSLQLPVHVCFGDIGLKKGYFIPSRLSFTQTWPTVFTVTYTQLQASPTYTEPLTQTQIIWEPWFDYAIIHLACLSLLY
jgi:hypothetical protein